MWLYVNKKKIMFQLLLCIIFRIYSLDILKAKNFIYSIFRCKFNIEA
jgi:hypothetical protein